MINAISLPILVFGIVSQPFGEHWQHQWTVAQRCRVPFSGITSSGRVWKKMPEIQAWSVALCVPAYWQMCRDEEYSVSGITNRAQELCESRGGHRWLPVRNSLYGLCGHKATLSSAEPILAEFGGKCVKTKCGAWHWIYMSDCCVSGVDVNTQLLCWRGGCEYPVAVLQGWMWIPSCCVAGVDVNTQLLCCRGGCDC